jgi:hypothetical protein
MASVRDIRVSPVLPTKGADWIRIDIAGAVSDIRDRDAGARVLYASMGSNLERGMKKSAIRPAGAYEHLLKPENRTRVDKLTTAFNIAWKSGEHAKGLKALKQMSKVAPGFTHADMLNDYTTSLHLAVHQHPLVIALFTELYGPGYQLLHNRASYRSKAGRLLVKDAALHKEGSPGELGYIFCLPGRRSFCMMPREHEQSLAPPGRTRFRKVSAFECTDPTGAHEVVSLDVEIPDGQIAIILFDHYKAHGIDPRGYGLNLYVSACKDEKLAELGAIRTDLCKRGKYKIDHDHRMRDPNLSYLDTIHIGLIAGKPDQLWPSGKVIYANGVHTQSHGPNRPKFLDEDVQYRLPQADDGEASPPTKRRRLEACGLGHLPQWVDHIQWHLDPNELPEEQRKHWGIPK